MSKVRYEFVGTLVAVSPLHVGSGEFRKVAAVTGKTGQQPPEVAAIVRGHDGRPYLPATTLKGLVRRLAEMPDSGIAVEDREALFGLPGSEGRDDRVGGRMGVLLFRGAQCTETADMREAPFADADPHPARVGDGMLGPGVFVAARTRIDPGSGTAADSTLFFQEMVGAGAEFDFRVLLELRDEHAELKGERLVRAFVSLLSRMAQADGHPIGKGRADGFGVIRLKERSVGISIRLLSAASRTFSDTNRTAALWDARPRVAFATATTPRTLTLHCDGPYLSIDASRASRRGEGSPEGDGPQISPQRLRDRLPLVLATGIAGALRSRARWLAAAKMRFDASKLDDERHVATLDDAQTLDPVQRLFGVTGFRGLLAIEKVRVQEAEPWNVTSVKLDRFSGAPIDNALFTTGTFVGVRVEVRLGLEKRPSIVPSQRDRDLYEMLLKDIRRHGLQLGHGGNKGFGWFRLAEATDAG